MSRALRSIVDAPVTVPTLLVTVLLAIWADSQGGYPPTTWYPGALFLLALLAVCLVVLPGRLGEVPAPVRVALACLLAYALWSYLSITWAQAKGDAWDGANRTLLYVIVFALFAVWPQHGRQAAVVLGGWTLAIAGIALATLVRVSSSVDPSGLFISDRLAQPAGYPNASAAMLMMAFFPAVVLAGRPEVAWWLRGVFGGAAVLIADVALLSQSRGSIYSIPILVIVFFAAIPGRLRSLAVLMAVAPAVAVNVPKILHVGAQLRDGVAAHDAVSGVALPIVLATLAVIALVTAAAAFEHTRRFTREAERRVALTMRAAGVAIGVAVVVVALAFAGNPVARARDGWRSFKRGQPVTRSGGVTRLAGGLGSNRYDAYRVALNTLAAHPLNGIGADNFLQDYLRHGRSDESLRYPHSLEMRTLAETGLVGAALLLAAIGAILVGALRAAHRRRDPLARAVAGGATMVFAYWLVHGSFDWFFEFAGLGAAAFAMAGLACALAPRDEPARVDGDALRPLIRGVWIVPVIVVGVLAAGSFAAPWLAERDVQRAARTWPADPASAYRRLHQAERLNPLNDRAALIAGSIALRLNDLPRARGYFESALRRDPRGVYATLELGLVASQSGRRAAADRLLARAAALSPHDSVIRAAQRRARSGHRLRVSVINKQILERAKEITAPPKARSTTG